MVKRKKILSIAQSQAIAEGAAELFSGKEFELESKDIINLTAKCNLSAYDFADDSTIQPKKLSWYCAYRFRNL
ncbi:MAG: hypothetical protein AAGA16_04460 [Cyanobacteria bacterium P01_E01_bin.35]